MWICGLIKISKNISKKLDINKKKFIMFYLNVSGNFLFLVEKSFFSSWRYIW